MEHESINLPQIMKVLGDRPFPLKESVREYLEELEKRQHKEEGEAADAAMKASTEESDAAKGDDRASKTAEELVDAAVPFEDD